MSYHRLQTEAWLSRIEVKADRVLDVGGSQLPIRGRTKSWEVRDYKILDIETPHEVKQPAEIVADIQVSTFCPDNFDVAFCIEVSEYWIAPLTALSNINLCC